MRGKKRGEFHARVLCFLESRNSFVAFLHVRQISLIYDTQYRRKSNPDFRCICSSELSSVPFTENPRYTHIYSQRLNI